MQLDEIIERLEKAAGPDREIDWDIQQEMFGIGAVDFHGTPRYSDSVDAALALAERVLPWIPWFDIEGVNRRPDANGIWKVTIDGAHSARAQTLPFAICLATLRALSNQSGGER